MTFCPDGGSKVREQEESPGTVLGGGTRRIHSKCNPNLFDSCGGVAKK